MPQVVDAFGIAAAELKRSIAPFQGLVALEPLVIEVHMPGDDGDKPTGREEVSLEDVSAKMPSAPER